MRTQKTKSNVQWGRSEKGIVQSRPDWVFKPTCYASIVNKANFRHITKHNEHRLTFDLSKHLKLQTA